MHFGLEFSPVLDVVWRGFLGAMGEFKRNKSGFVVDLLLLGIAWIGYIFLLGGCSVLYMYRILVHLAAKIFRPDLIPINNSMDNAMTPEPSSSHAKTNCCQVWFLEGRLSVDVFRNHFQKTFLGSEELRRRYGNLYCHFVRWGSYNFKKMSEMDLKERIKEEWLLETSGSEVEAFVGKWLDTNDYGDKPNWEIVLLHVRKGGGDERTVVLFKIDHGLCDGYTFVHFVERLSGVKSPYQVKNEGISWWNKVKGWVRLPWLTVQLVRKLMATPDLVWSKDEEGDSRMYLSLSSFELETVKKIRKLGRCHFNTVLGVVQADALRKFFKETGRVRRNGERPGNISLASAAPWPEHPAMVDGGGMGNHLSGMMFKVSLEEESPVQRLQKAEEDFLDMSGFGLPAAFFIYYMPLAWAIPHSLFTSVKALMHRAGVISNQSYYFSPLMLSHEGYQLLGIPVDHLYLPLHLQSIAPCLRMITIPVSNGGRLDISVSGRYDSFRSQEEVDYLTKVLMKESLEELLVALEEEANEEFMNMKETQGHFVDIVTYN